MKEQRNQVAVWLWHTGEIDWFSGKRHLTLIF